MTRKVLLVSAGLVLLSVGAFLPSLWPERSVIASSAAPWSGIRLIQLGFEIEGLLLFLLGILGVRWPAASPENLLELPAPEGEDVRHPLLWLSAATALAAALRFYRIGSDLWLDEITTVLDYQHASAFDVLTQYTSSNNHLVNTLLVKAMIAAFGPVEWAIRLPAVIFGIACIPAVYAMARIALARRESLFAAFLLAVSYHHIFFSQNARGYTGLLFWSMLGTTFFLRGVARDRPRDWVLYVVSMFLAVATVLYGVFVIAGHVLSWGVGVVRLRHQRKVFWPLTRRLLLVWAVIGLLCLHLYASVLAQVNAYATTIYRTQAVGYRLFSSEYFRELFRGVAAGFGEAAVLGALAAAAVIGLGFLIFLQRHVLYTLTLISPLIVTVAFLLARGLRFSPRFFLWILPVAWIFSVAAATCLGGWLRSRKSWAPPARQKIARAVPYLVVGILFGLSAASLPAYYRVPKQPQRASLDWVLAHRQAGDPIVAAYLAKWGLRFYGPARGLTEGESFFSLSSPEELQKIEGASGNHTIWLLTTFPRALRLEYPDLDRYIRAHYQERKTFAATIGDGEVTILAREAS